MPVKKQQSILAGSSFAYYATRSIQRICLIFTALATFGVYVAYVNMAMTTPYVSGIDAGTYSLIDYTGVSADFIEETSIIAGFMAAASVIASMCLWAFPRVRKYQKQLVVDGVVISSTLLILTIFTETVVRFVIARMG